VLLSRLSAADRAYVNEVRVDHPKPQMRIWTDDTGKYRRSARLVRSSQHHVRLQAESGEVLTVPLARLSTSDRQYVREMERARSKGSLIGQLVDVTR
jgi:hypothetical protein